MTPRRLQPHEGSLLKSLRIRAVRECPIAYTATPAELEAKPDAAWAADAARFATAADAVCLLAEDDAGRAVGLAGAFRDADAPDRANFFGLWVAPEHRRHGVASSLMAAVAGWALASGARALQVWATEANHRALAFYRREGFRETGDRQPYKPDPMLSEILLRRPLSGKAGSKP